MPLTTGIYDIINEENWQFLCVCLKVLYQCKNAVA